MNRASSIALPSYYWMFLFVFLVAQLLFYESLSHKLYEGVYKKSLWITIRSETFLLFQV